MLLSVQCTVYTLIFHWRYGIRTINLNDKSYGETFENCGGAAPVKPFPNLYHYPRLNIFGFLVGQD